MVIPRIYLSFWLGKNEDGVAQRALMDLPIVGKIEFSFFMPKFTGFSPENYRKSFDEDRVDVIELRSADSAQAAPDAPGSYPPNMIGRLFKSGVDPGDYLEKYGLRCYSDRAELKPPSQRFCYGLRDTDTTEFILLEVPFPPYRQGVANYPLMRTHYFTSRHGGMYIAWRANIKYFPQWREIDNHIWELIDAWVMAGSSASSAL